MAIDKKYINIRFPFQKSDEGQYLQLNKTTKEAIKSDLLHLLLTNKGDRLYMPDFGTNLYKYVFEQNDSISHSEIKREISILGCFVQFLKLDNTSVFSRSKEIFD